MWTLWVRAKARVCITHAEIEQNTGCAKSGGDKVGRPSTPALLVARCVPTIAVAKHSSVAQTVAAQTPAVVELDVFEKQINVSGIWRNKPLELSHGNIDSDGVLEGFGSRIADVFHCW